MPSLEEGNYEDDDQQPYQQNDSLGHQMSFRVLLIEIIISLDRADILGILVDISIVDIDHVDMN